MNRSYTSGYAWSVYILPQLEQNNLYESLNVNGRTPRTSSANLTIYNCPSDSEPNAGGATMTVYNYSCYRPSWAPARLGNCPYVRYNGTTTEPDPQGGVSYPASNYPANSWLFNRNTKYRLDDLTNGGGASNCILVGERSREHGMTTWLAGYATGNRYRYNMPAEYRWASYYNGRIFTSRNYYSAVGAAYYINRNSSGTTYPYMSSQHTGGAHFCFGDGRVKFLSETLAWRVLYDLASPTRSPTGNY